MAKENKNSEYFNNITMVAIVGIVAIVALTFYSGGTNSSTASDDEAIAALTDTLMEENPDLTIEEAEDLAGQAWGRRSRSRSTTSFTCSDSDGYNHNIAGSTVYGGTTYKDSCYRNEQKYALDYYCSSGRIRSGWKDCNADGKVCANGACIVDANYVPPICNDSDGSFNYDVKGVVTYGSTTNTDTCSGTRWANDYYCQNEKPTYKWQDCNAIGKVCEDGACTGSFEAPQCNDTDGGLNFDVKGEVTFGTSKYPDQCYQNKDQWALDNYCLNGQRRSQWMDCKKSGKLCKDGACVAIQVSTAQNTSNTTAKFEYGGCMVRTGPKNEMRKATDADVGSTYVKRDFVGEAKDISAVKQECNSNVINGLVSQYCSGQSKREHYVKVALTYDKAGNVLQTPSIDANGQKTYCTGYLPANMTSSGTNSTASNSTT